MPSAAGQVTPMTRTQLVTGGAGFIGSNYVRSVLRETRDHVLIVDKLTYAGNLATIRDVLADPRTDFVQADIADAGRIAELLRDFRPAFIVNFAAESHVDRSIEGPRNFVHSNIVGVFELLENVRRYLRELPSDDREAFRFLQVSTDEVFGSLGPEGAFVEDTPYAPRSPYSASKASADFLVRAYHETYALPTLITNCSNNYGPYQFPEKLIPLCTHKALEGKRIPVYGLGENIRDWLHVEDHCEAISRVLARGQVGSTYNIGARNERTNLEVVHSICEALERVLPAAQNPRLKEAGHSTYRELVTFVEDRPGHDFRYAIDPSRIETELDWKAKRPFLQSLEDTVRWIVENRDWSSEVQAGVYDGERLGLDE